MIKRVRVLCHGLLVWGLSAGAFAKATNQTSSTTATLPEILVTTPGTEEESVATAKTGLPLKDIPSSVQVIPENVFQEQGATRLNDGIMNVPGVGINSGLNFFDLFMLRGYEAEIYRDGIREQRDLRHSLFDVDRVEVLRGPASVLYGRGEPGGIINVISKEPSREELAVVDFGMKTFFTGHDPVAQQNIGLDLGGPLASELFYRFNMVQDSSDCWRDYVNYRYRDVSGSVAWVPTENDNLTLSFAHYDHQDVVDDGLVSLNGVFPDVDRETYYGARWNTDETEVYRTTLRWDRRVNEALTLKNTVNYEDYWAYDFSQRPYGATDVNTVEMEQREFDINSRTLTALSEAYYHADRNDFMAGVEIAHTDAQRDDWDTYSGIPPNSLLNPDADRGAVPWDTLPGSHVANNDYDLLTLAVFAQDTVTLADFLKAVGGVRVDQFEQEYKNYLASPVGEADRSDTEVSPRGGIVFQPAEWTSFYYSYSVGFRPSGQDAPWGDVELDPEKAIQHEIGNKSSFFENKISTTLALYDLVRKDVQVGLPDGTSEQIGKWDTKGLEFTVEGRPVDAWNISASFTLTDAEMEEGGTWYTGDTPPNVPEQTVSFWTTYDLTERWEVGGGVRYVGDREAMYDNSLDLFDPYTTAHLTLAYKAKTWEARLNADNIFDEEYFVGGRGWYAQALPGDPASLSLSVRKTF